ncbi:hypothetical protein ASPSYDRAFT_452544 [Aspergillus sydowii CBS 593.65]|uniref:Uncharacterized protein n=1 Tax=Aspergillus sydowii CBS 593.65 TaxID=1036612 RepID=A0A1L9T745_9EURO|nr:uncharacterized protein ASPSYDRAFT_452544 [Aspergillus sydowii CBS 593.65]OJJ55191.1 hypothetical protein ASPSYDRAFT_452544 [Aspergillus sydowii CBS 593.65]
MSQTPNSEQTVQGLRKCLARILKQDSCRGRLHRKLVVDRSSVLILYYLYVVCHGYSTNIARFLGYCTPDPSSQYFV